MPTITVTTLDDNTTSDSETTLREAIAAANTDGTTDTGDTGSGIDTIVFSPGLEGTIRLTLGELAITDAVVIDGDGRILITGDANADDIVDADGFTSVDASRAPLFDGVDNDGLNGIDDPAESLLDDNSRIFNVTSGSAATTLIGLTLTGGYTDGLADVGGAVRSVADLTIETSRISGNATAGTNATGGGIFGTNDVTLTDSTVSGNATSGADATGGGIAGLDVTLTNVTVSGNATAGTDADGGGVRAFNTAILTNATVTGNATAGATAEGGGLFAGGASPGFVVLTNSLVLGNVTSYAGLGGDEIATDTPGGYTFNGNNIVGADTAAFDTTGEVNVVNADPNAVFAGLVDNEGVLAGRLADNGGPVETVALLPWAANPAVDQGDDAFIPATDARGFARPADSALATDGPDGNSDIGAFELQIDEALTVTTLTDELDNAAGTTVADMGGANDLSLREAIAIANARPGLNTITFEFGLTDGVIRLNYNGGQELEITDALTIDGQNRNIVISGDVSDNDERISFASEITDILASRNAATLGDNVRIFNITDASAATRLYGLTLSGGYTDGVGEDGGAIRSLADLTLEDTSVRGNATGGDDADGGGIFGGTVTLVRSQVLGDRTFGVGAEGGGIFGTDVTLTESTVRANSTAGAGSQGGGVFGSGDVVLTRSTVNDNATAGDNAEGGGVIGFGDVVLTNATVSGNSTAGVSSEGGGIAAGVDVALINSTVSGNSTSGAGSQGGGILGTGDVALTNSLVLGNATSYAGVGGDEIVTLTPGGYDFTGNNIVGADAAAFDTTGEVNVVNADPTAVFADTVDIGGGVLAGVLANRGGPVETIALLTSTTNPALDQGDDNLAPATDARGVARPVDLPLVADGPDGNSDIGAFELQAALIVTTLDDELDNPAGTTVAEMGGANDLSLREAIAIANATPGLDNIFFDPGLANGLIRLNYDGGRELLITDTPLTIDGEDRNITITGDADGDDVTLPGNVTDVDATRAAGDLDDNVRVFNIDDGDVSNDDVTTLKGLTLTGGNAAGSGGAVLSTGRTLTLESTTVVGNAASGGGGGVSGSLYVNLVDSTVSDNFALGGGAGGVRSVVWLDLTNSTVSGNSAAGNGGGIAAYFGFITLTDSTVSGNSTTGASNDDGGGIYGGSNVFLTRSTVSDNSTAGDFSQGGGIISENGSVMLIDSIVSGNSTAGDDSDGGGISADGSVTLTSSLVSDNSTMGRSSPGGGIQAGTVTLTDSSVSDNSTTGRYSGGGGINGGTVTVTNSTVSGNSTADVESSGGGIRGFTVTLTDSAVSGNSTGGRRSEGGGIDGSTVTLTNSTVAGNSTADEFSEGGGIYAFNSVTLTNATVTGNATAGYDSAGGGVFADGITLTNSLVLGNTTSHAGIGGDEIATKSPGGYTFNGNNIVGADMAAFDTTGEVNVVNADPSEVFAQTFDNSGVDAGVLSDNGGPVETVSLLPSATNPALDKGDDTPAPLTDGRGFVRPVDLGAVADGPDGNSDIGSFEMQAGEVLIVTTLDDELDNPAGLTVADMGGYADLSLREAIVLANNVVGLNAITFDPGLANGLIRLNYAGGQELEITEAVSINGQDRNITITGDVDMDDTLVGGTDITDVDATRTAGNLGDNVRIFNVSDASATTTLRGLTLTGGYLDANSDGGGAVYSAADLSVENSTLSGNAFVATVQYGGGAIFGKGDVNLSGTTVSDNRSDAEAGDGGGILALGDVTLESSTVSGNRTEGFLSSGGGISSGGNVEIRNSTVSGNGTLGANSNGGGIDASGTLLVEDSTISNNYTTQQFGAGGGARVTGEITITSSTISGNYTLGLESRGGGVSGGSDVSIVDSTISGNSAAGENGRGGGVYGGGNVTATNTTVSGNSTAGDFGYGGGIAGAGDVTLVNATVTGNSAAGDTFLANQPLGGGVHSGGQLSLTNSIVLGNVTTFAGIPGDEIATYGPTGNYVFNGHNIVGQDVAAFDPSPYSNVQNAAAADVFAATLDNNGVDAGVLADNGGPVETVALSGAGTNPALDQGDDSLIPASMTDARGETRPFDLVLLADGPDGNSDLGAFELQQITQLPGGPIALVVTTLDDELDSLAFDADLADMGGPGDLSLREAVWLANITGGGTDTITFDATLQDGLIRLNHAGGQEIAILDSLVIDGEDRNITITGDALGDDVTDAEGITDVAASSAGGLLDDNVRIFNVLYGSADTTLRGLTLTGGYTSGDFESGGAVRSSATLTVEASLVGGNSTAGTDAHGGGIFGTGDVTLTDSTVSDNSTAGYEAYGGGIFGAGDVTLTNTTVSDNATSGMYARGGGIFGLQLVTATESTVSGNSTQMIRADGAGIFGTDVVLTGSTVSGNSTAGYGADGGAFFATGTATLTNATISGNSTAGERAEGGGIYSLGDVALTNSTVTGNATAGPSAEGGGIYAYGGNIALTNSIVLGNVTTYAGLGYDEIATYAPTGSYTFNGNNIVGANQAAFDTTVEANVQNAAAAEVFAATLDNNGVDAGVLADNGGPVETVALLADEDNPALDTGDDSLLGGLTTDARGEIRPFNAEHGDGPDESDLGAFELQERVLNTILGTPDPDTLDGTLWPDLIQGLGSADVIDGGALSDILEGGGGADEIHGSFGNDDISGGGGADMLFGEGGFDRLSGGSGSDELDGGDGNDRLFGQGGHDLLLGGADEDLLRGGSGNDELRGGGENDRLHGQAGRDRLFGGEGDDLLEGGIARDWMTGGAGADIFAFLQGDGEDTVRDFESGVDSVDLTGHVGVDEFADIVQNTTAEGALADLGNGDSILFKGREWGVSLLESDFQI